MDKWNNWRNWEVCPRLSGREQSKQWEFKGHIFYSQYTARSFGENELNLLIAQSRKYAKRRDLQHQIYAFIRLRGAREASALLYVYEEPLDYKIDTSFHSYDQRFYLEDIPQTRIWIAQYGELPPEWKAKVPKPPETISWKMIKA